ncbi:hypothetical protein D5F01_LYC20799 [Larimichthys crocea]|uniref:Protein kinase domain-containing protein n=1 Tax=Larimichthys crocea TaxID=215358 RepID=A0A6G0HM33_LARCR|nr:hypothetical protein D5F01_LYC20799 [Larimichthys crocea]
MNDLSNHAISRVQQLLHLVERYDLHHVKTLPYNNVQGVLEWLGANHSKRSFGHEEDTVTVLNMFVRERGLNTVQVMAIDETPQLEGKERLVTHCRSSCIVYKAFMPMVELDTLKGLEYLRSRTIQHRDFTYKNVLVCHQLDRKSLLFTFKISDFGTSCNFSTPDQPWANRTNMAPEVLWCLNTATGSDIFSWYCVMWELHGNSSLVQHKAPGKTYCKNTYAENLSELVGVYNPERGKVFELNYMTAMRACGVHAKHKNRRPSVEAISAKLQHIGNIADRYFVSMGVLCITLYPQERWSPLKLLSLPRYQYLRADFDEAQCTPACPCLCE